MKRILWKSDVYADGAGNFQWRTRIVVPVLIGGAIGLTCGLYILGVSL